MTKREIESCRQQLLELAKRLGGEVAELRNEALRPTGGEASGSLSNLPIHQGDLGSRQYEEDLTLNLVGNEEKMLGEVNAALNRLDQGAFGRCEGCQKEIGAERLRALPYARNCVACARQAGT